MAQVNQQSLRYYPKHRDFSAIYNRKGRSVLVHGPNQTAITQRPSQTTRDLFDLYIRKGLFLLVDAHKYM